MPPETSVGFLAKLYEAFDDADNRIRVSIDGGTFELTPGDVEIGAVELKNATDDTRAVIGTSTPAAAAGGLTTREAPTAGTSTQPADITVDATSGGVVLLAANASRKSAVIQNTGAATMRLRIDGDPTTTRGLQIAAGQSFNIGMPFCPTGAIKAIREGSTSTTAAVMEIA